MENKPRKECYFSIELKSKTNLKNITLTNDDKENVLIEGSVGQLLSAEFVEAVILEIVGDNGVLRINLTTDEIKQPKLPLNSTNKTNGGVKQ